MPSTDLYTWALQWGWTIALFGLLITSILTATSPHTPGKGEKT